MFNLKIHLFLLIIFSVFAFQLCMTSSSSASILRPIVDSKEYKYFQLPNKLRILLVHNPSAKVSAASLQVNVGSLSNPRDVPGLAHFLEHMLFMGSGKYPDPETFFTFVNSNSGRANAFTDYNRTNYFFQIPSDSFEKAFDIFAHFFVDPLFNITTVEKEINAVESEFEKTFQIDEFRDEFVLQTSCNQTTSFSKFFCGSYDTLLNIPKQKGINLRDALIGFFDTYYSAHLMTLVVISNYNISKLETWTYNNFRSVKSKKIIPDIHGLEDVLPDLPKIISYIPISEKDGLKLSFPIPSQLSDYRVKAYIYLDKQISYKGQGGLYDILVKQGWVKNILFGFTLHSQEIDIYSIYYELTSRGLQHVYEILQWTFTLVRKVQKEGVNYARFSEYSDEARISFNYFPPFDDPYVYANKLSNNIHEYHEESILAGSTVFDRYDYSMIMEFLRGFTIENCIIRVSSKEFQYKPESISPIEINTNQRRLYFHNVNKKNEFYRFQYAEYDLSQINLLPFRVLNTIFISLSSENNLIPKQFNLMSPSVTSINAQVTPQRIISSEKLEVWHSQFNYDKYPIVHVTIDIFYPPALSSVNEQTTYIVLFQAIKKRTDEIISQGLEVGYKLEQTFEQDRITLDISGLGDKIGIVSDKMLSGLQNLALSEREYIYFQKQAIVELENAKFDPLYKIAIRNIRKFLKRHGFSYEGILEALKPMPYESFKQLSDSLQSSLSITALVIGNIDTQEIKKIFMSTEKNLKVVTNDPRALRQEYANIRGTSFVVRDWSPFVDSKEQCIVSYYSYEKRTPENIAAITIINSVLDPYIFNSLRTEQQLGYIAVSVVEKELSAAGLFVILQGSKEDPVFFNTEIEKTLKDFGEENLANISVEDFNVMKENYKDQIVQTQKDLLLRSRSWMCQIRDGSLEFDADEKSIKYLESLTIDDIKEIYRSLFKDGGKFSYLVHTKGENKTESFDEEADMTSVLSNRKEKIVTKKDDILAYF